MFILTYALRNKTKFELNNLIKKDIKSDLNLM